ncbi:MAG: Omp28-related outer membrane protein [Ignavibacteria bacterium]|nr:Omp28-related outer membrane protein [Ignavibacteria bacterium]
MNKRMTAFWTAMLAVLCISSVALGQSVYDNTMTPQLSSQAVSMQKSGPSNALAQWTGLAPLPAAKQYHGSVFYNGAIYVFGGINPTGSGYDLNCAKYDIAGATWSTIAPLPSPRALPCVEVVNGKIYIIGGYSATNPWVTEKAVIEYDPAANTYATKANIPFGVFSAGSFVSDNRIWILGGGTTAFATGSNGIQIYDPAQDKWTFSLSLLPAQLRAFGTAIVGTTVYVLGGATYPGGALTPSAKFYKGVVNADQINFTTLANYPNGTIHRHSMGTNGTRVYVTGGIDAASTVTVATQEYDPVADAWTGKEQKPTGVYYAGAFVADASGKLYVAGGQSAAGPAVTNFEAFNPTVAALPKLELSSVSVDDWAKRSGTKKIAFAIRNPGGAALTYNIAVTGSGATWLSASKTSGTVQVGKADAIDILVSGANLTVGDNSGALTITSNDPDKPTVDVPVLIHAQDQDVDADLNVLVEEGTGTWCQYCPQGADSLKSVIAQNPGRVYGISYHGGHSSEPMQTPSTAVWTAQIGLTGWPQASINRIRFEGASAIALNRGEWAERARTLLTTRRAPVSVNILSSTYNNATKEIIMEVEVFFHRTFTQPVRLNIAQVQDHMSYPQQTTGGVVLRPYFHDHVLRQMIPNAFGEVISSGANVASQTSVKKTLTFTSVDSTIGTSRLIVFAHVSNGTTYGEILQTEEVPLASFVTAVDDRPAAETFTLSQNFPNPFNPSTTISFAVPRESHVSVVLTDAYGRTLATLADESYAPGTHSLVFNADGLASGTYLFTMRAGSFVQTRTMTLVK